jgi:hypothetical protein
VATTLDTGQQWDAPNGSAPLQWIAVEGLISYGQNQRDDRVPMDGQRLASLRQTDKLVENTSPWSICSACSPPPKRSWPQLLRNPLITHPTADPRINKAIGGAKATMGMSIL